MSGTTLRARSLSVRLILSTTTMRSGRWAIGTHPLMARSDSSGVGAITRTTSRSRSFRRTWSPGKPGDFRPEVHTSELQSLMRISYAAFCLKIDIIHTLFMLQIHFLTYYNYVEY